MEVEASTARINTLHKHHEKNFSLVEALSGKRHFKIFFLDLANFLSERIMRFTVNWTLMLFF